MRFEWPPGNHPCQSAWYWAQMFSPYAAIHAAESLVTTGWGPGGSPASDRSADIARTRHAARASRGLRKGTGGGDCRFIMASVDFLRPEEDRGRPGGHDHALVQRQLAQL